MTKSKLAEAFNQQMENRKPKPDPEAKGQSKTGSQASREGKKSLNAFVEPEVAKLLKKIALDTDRTQQDLILEALNDLFVKYGKQPIA